MKTDSYSWLYLEPYVHLTIQGDRVLLYNTLSHKLLTLTAKPAVSKICRSLLKPSNGNVIRINHDDFKKADVSAFINELKNSFMGDTLRASWSAKKPVMILPKPLIKRQKSIIPASSLEMLREVTLHLTTGNSGLTRKYGLAYRQFTFPMYVNGKKKEMSVSTLKKVMDACNTGPRLNINLVCDNLNQCRNLDELTGLLAHPGHRIRFFTFPESVDKRLINKLPKNSGFGFLLSFPFNEEIIRQTTEIIKASGLRNHHEWHFVVQDSHELTDANSLIQSLALKNSFFKPYFNKTNITFFRDYIYITEEDLKDSKPDQQQIFARKIVNETEWGKITILPGGSVVANINDPPLGNILHDRLDQIIGKELEKGTSWKRIRPDALPCRDCLYNLLCPPVSSYELVMKRFNLCHIYK